MRALFLSLAVAALAAGAAAHRVGAKVITGCSYCLLPLVGVQACCQHLRCRQHNLRGACAVRARHLAAAAANCGSLQAVQHIQVCGLACNPSCHALNHQQGAFHETTPETQNYIRAKVAFCNK